VTAIKGMAEAQAALGHGVTILATKIGDETAPVLKGVEIRLYPCEFIGWRWSKGLAGALPSLVEKADIVHIHTLWQYPTWAAAGVCQSLGKPYIIRSCGMLEHWSLSQSSFKKRLYLLFGGNSRLKGAAAIHFTSESERINSLRPSKDFVIPIGLRSSAYENLPSELAFKKRFPVLENKKIVLFLGRLHYKKQPDVAIRAFALVYNDHPDACLVLAGPGDPNYVAGLDQLVHRLGIEKRVFFLGMLQGETVREAYRAAAFFVLPSFQENFGISVAEAMAAGCPVVVSEQVSLSKEVARANSGIVCSAEVKPTAEAMSRLLGDSGLREKMGINGRNLIVNQFTWEKVAADLIDVYSDILSNLHVHPAWTKG